MGKLKLKSVNALSFVKLTAWVLRMMDGERTMVLGRMMVPERGRTMVRGLGRMMVRRRIQLRDCSCIPEPWQGWQVRGLR